MHVCVCVCMCVPHSHSPLNTFCQWPSSCVYTRTSQRTLSTNLIGTSPCRDTIPTSRRCVWLSCVVCCVYVCVSCVVCSVLCSMCVCVCVYVCVWVPTNNFLLQLPDWQTSTKPLTPLHVSTQPQGERSAQHNTRTHHTPHTQAYHTHTCTHAQTHIH